MAVGEKSSKPDRRLVPRNPLKDEDFFSERLRDSEKAAGLIRPLRNVHRHMVCGNISKIELDLAVLLAKNPRAFTGLRCLYCGFRPITEFCWDGGNELVGR